MLFHWQFLNPIIVLIVLLLHPVIVVPGFNCGYSFFMLPINSRWTVREVCSLSHVAKFLLHSLLSVTSFFRDKLGNAEMATSPINRDLKAAAVVSVNLHRAAVTTSRTRERCRIKEAQQFPACQSVFVFTLL